MLELLRWRIKQVQFTAFGIKPHSSLQFTGATVQRTEPGKDIAKCRSLNRNGKILPLISRSTLDVATVPSIAKATILYAGFIDLCTVITGLMRQEEGGSDSYRDEPVYQNERQGGNASNAAIHAEQQWVNTF
ncbi:MAG: hypothetical protein U5L01_08075 [Rheinheimera sp.]|nr:hypothetical protein [Rheinheimera sp.]